MDTEQKALARQFDELMRQLGITDDSFGEVDRNALRLELLSEPVFKQETPKIGVVGATNQGKSVLANAILGKRAFQVGADWDVTVQVQSETHASGLVIYDTPGLDSGNAELAEATSRFIDQCDLLLYVVKHPGFSHMHHEMFRNQIAPHAKPCIIVINLESEEARAEATNSMKQALSPSSFSSNRDIVRDVVKVNPHTEADIGHLVQEIITALPEQFHQRFEAALDKRYVRTSRLQRIYQYSINAAAIGSTRLVAGSASSDRREAGYTNISTVLTLGFCLKIASLFDTEFTEGTFVLEHTDEVRKQRYEVREEPSRTPRGLIGTLIGAAMGAFGAQTTLAAALFGAPLGPAGIAAAGLTMAALGAVIGTISKQTAFKTVRIAQVGGYDMAIATLAYGYATAKVMFEYGTTQHDPHQSPDWLELKQREVGRKFSEYWQLCNQTQIRDLFDDTVRHRLNTASQQDEAVIRRLLESNSALHDLFEGLGK